MIRSLGCHKNAALENPENMRLLEKSFSPEDWQYLIHNGTFKERLAGKNETLDDYEEIVGIGELLIRQRDELRGKAKSL